MKEDYHASLWQCLLFFRRLRPLSFNTRHKAWNKIEVHFLFLEPSEIKFSDYAHLVISFHSPFTWISHRRPKLQLWDDHLSSLGTRYLAPVILEQFVHVAWRYGPRGGSICKGGRVTSWNSTVVCRGECERGLLETSKLEILEANFGLA